MAAILNQEYADILVDNSFGLFALLNTKGEIIKLNQRLLNLRGFKQEDVAGKSIFDIAKVDPNQKETFQQGFETVVSLGEAFQFETITPTPKGLANIVITLSAVHNEVGEAIYIIAEGHDISQQKMYEKNLAEEQAFINAILDNTTEGISVFDSNGKKTYINEVARDLTGLNYMSDVVNSDIPNPYEFYSIDGKKLLPLDELPLGLALKGVEVRDFEEIIRLKPNLPSEFNELKQNFVPKSLSVSSRILKTEDGEIKSIILSYKDITQKKIYQQQLAGEQAFTKAILDNTADGVISYDAAGNRTYSNVVAQKMFAIDRYPYLEESGLENTFDLYALDSKTPLPKNKRPIDLALQGKEVKDLELRIQTKDKLPKELSDLKESFTPIRLSVNSRIIRDEYGEIASIVTSYNDITEQKIYQQKLVDERAFYSVVLNNTADGIFVFNAEGKITFSNVIARDMFYFDAYPEIEKLNGHTVFNFYSLDEGKHLSQDEMPFEIALKDEEVQNFEILIELKDELPPSLLGLRDTFEPKRVSISSRIIRNDANELVEVVMSYNDIAERVIATQAQAALQERFSHAFDNAVIGIGILSSKGIILEANDALSSMLDYDNPKELVDKSLGDITHPDDMTLTEVLFSEIEVGARNSVYYEKKLKNKKGRAVVSIIGISVSRADDGSINYLIAHFLDVTENNKISKALALSQENYQSIFNSQLDAVIVTNLSGKILNINPSAVKLFGYKIEEIDGLMFWELFSAKEDQLSLFESLYTEDQEKIHTDSIRYAHRNGDAFPAETVGFVIFDGDEQRLGYTWIIQDVSEKKIAEITLARINQRLAVSREEERRRLARELHDGIVQDLMGFSYELASLEGSLNKKDDFAVDANDLKGMRGKLTDSIKQLRSFISDLRPVGLEEFGFQSALESYVALLERDRQSMRTFPKITLKIDDVGDLPIPINLCLFRSAQEGLSNIIRHANAKNVVVGLVMKQSKVMNLVLTIKDDGIGFKVPEDIDDFSESQHFGLIGINERVTLMDGHLAIKSQKNKGTTLTLTLPYEMDN